jgi:REP element-mobilizing transposase RayT
MPIRNTTKLYDAPAYYHVYNRGAGNQTIFRDDGDRQKFLSIFARHLDPDDESIKSDGVPYEKYAVELVAYCLMGNHFHLLLYQEDDLQAITKLMRSVSTAYSMYFNYKYRQHGHVFQSIFKAAKITDEVYLLHITRYIHMNPRSYLSYKWSSIAYYQGKKPPAWVSAEKVNTMSPRQYREFLESYEGKKAELGLLREQLAS